MVVQILSNLKSLWKWKKIRADYTIFRLHHRFTVLLLLVCCLIVTTKQYGGEPIVCTRNSKQHSNVIDNYCLITTTYTIKSAYNDSIEDNKNNPHPGIKPSQDSSDYLYHRYYQYVGFILFFQAVFFYFPHWLWKTFEGGKLEYLMSGINMRYTCLSKSEIEGGHEQILQTLVRNWGQCTYYPIKYFVCEVLCLLNVLLQMLMLDAFFGGQFMALGLDFIHAVRTDAFDLMVKVFPRVTNCSFKYYGETGKVVQISVLCILSVNVINEKVFVLLWFWLVLLAVLSLWVVVFRFVSFVVRPLRFLILRARFRLLDQSQLKALIDKASLTDWFLLLLIGQNMDDVDFRNFVADLAEKIVLRRNV